MCDDLKNDTISTVWGNVRTSVLNIWFSRKSLISGTSSIHLIHSEDIPNIEIFPNPTSDILNFNTDKIKIISVKFLIKKEVLSNLLYPKIMKFQLAIYLWNLYF